MAADANDRLTVMAIGGRDGTERRRWLGPFDPAEALEAADALSRFPA